MSTLTTVKKDFKKEMSEYAKVEKMVADLENYGNDKFYFLQEAKKNIFHVANKDKFKITGLNKKGKELIAELKKLKEKLKKDDDIDTEIEKVKENVDLDYKFDSEKKFISYLLNLYKVDTDFYLQNKNDIDYRIKRALMKQFPVKYIFNPHVKGGLIKGDSFLVLNSFKETKYMKIAKKIKARHSHMNEEEFKKAFPHFYLLLMNLCEYNYNYVKILLNYLAYVTQKRIKTNVIFAFKTIQGAGKGLFMDSVVSPLLHDNQVLLSSLEGLGKRFNGLLSEMLMIVIDETQHNPQKNGAISQKIKALAANAKTEIEKKFSDSQQVKTYFNFMVFTNNNDGIKVEPDDRRYYVFSSSLNLNELIRKKFKVDFAIDIRDYIRSNFIESEEADRFLTYVATLKTFETLASEAVIFNKSKVNMIFNTNNLFEIFVKIIDRAKLDAIMFLYKKILEINENNIEENKYLEEENKDLRYPTLDEEILKEFFVEYIENRRVKTSIFHKVLEVFLSAKSEVYSKKRLATEISKAFNVDIKKSNGFRYYVFKRNDDINNDNKIYDAAEFFAKLKEFDLRTEEEIFKILEEDFIIEELDELYENAIEIIAE